MLLVHVALEKNISIAMDEMYKSSSYLISLRPIDTMVDTFIRSEKRSSKEKLNIWVYPEE